MQSRGFFVKLHQANLGTSRPARSERWLLTRTRPGRTVPSHITLRVGKGERGLGGGGGQPLISWGQLCCVGMQVCPSVSAPLHPRRRRHAAECSSEQFPTCWISPGRQIVLKFNSLYIRETHQKQIRDTPGTLVILSNAKTCLMKPCAQA